MELEAILEKEILPTTIPEFPTVRRMTLGMNSSLVVPSLFARAAAETQQRELTDGWDPLFIGYTAAVYFHTCDIKINSWTTQAKKMRGSLPPKFEIRVCVWSDGDGVQPFPGLGSRRRSQKLRGGGEVLDREDSGNRHCRVRETELGLDSREKTRGD